MRLNRATSRNLNHRIGSDCLFHGSAWGDGSLVTRTVTSTPSIIYQLVPIVCARG
jgi:hypothetical protein